jgi:hypothetical protein
VRFGGQGCARDAMTVEELTIAVREANHSKAWPALVERMRQLDDDEAFNLLFPLATSAQWDCPLAYSAALLLYQIRPACPVPCKEALRALFGNWDVSIEEVPWYLRDAFGRQRVLEVIMELLAEPLSDLQVRRLRTVGYWLGVPESERSSWRSGRCD